MGSQGEAVENGSEDMGSQGEAVENGSEDMGSQEEAVENGGGVRTWGVREKQWRMKEE